MLAWKQLLPSIKTKFWKKLLRKFIALHDNSWIEKTRVGEYMPWYDGALQGHQVLRRCIVLWGYSRLDTGGWHQQQSSRISYEYHEHDGDGRCFAESKRSRALWLEAGELWSMMGFNTRKESSAVSVSASSAKRRSRCLGDAPSIIHVDSARNLYLVPTNTIPT